MARRLKNWIDAYMEYTEDTESAKVFHSWVARSMISAVLRKKTKLALGRISIYPNLYVVLVAEPGIARKSQAISFGAGILNEIPDIKTTADAITKEALIMEIEQSATEEFMPDGTQKSSCNISIISKEFETFLGQKKENAKMVVLLTDLFDSQDVPWRYKTKNAGENMIPSVYLSLLGATTPESLASSLPVQAIGGGLTSRILFVWASKKEKKVAKPILTPKVKKLKEDLINDLHHIARMAGTYEMSPECDAAWEAWYNQYEEQDPKRICKGPEFGGWYSRKPMYILKLAQIHAAASSPSLTLEWEHIQMAMQDIVDIEPGMGRVFSAVGRSETTVETEMVLNILRTRKRATEKQLLGILYRDMDTKKFQTIMDTLCRAGKVARDFTSNGGACTYAITPQGEAV